MRNNPPERRLWRMLPLLFLLLASAACGATPTPTAAPTPTTAHLSARSALVLVTRSTAPVATPTKQRPTPTPATGTADLGAFTIPLPETWQYQLLSDLDRSAELQQINRANPMLAQWVQQSEALPVEGQPWLTAWPKVGSGGVGLLAYVTPSFDLTIQRYLDALQRLLEEEETVVVREATLDYTLHEAHPVGYLHYTLVPAQPVATANQSPQTSESPQTVDGYQYLFFDRDGTTLLVMTFVVPQTGFPVAQPVDHDTIFAEMLSIVQAAAITDLQESQ